jgi:YVTN family beta-propeller protein
MTMQRMAVFLIVTILAVASITSCAFEQHPKGPRADEGQVFLYLSCPQKPAADITFAISGISFMNNNGEWIDVAMERQIDSAELFDKHQIKLAEFYLPAGKYERMKWKMSEAKVKRGAKSFSLALPEPDGEHFLDIKFVVFRRESLALFVDWNVEESVFNKYLFAPKMAIRKQGIEIKKTLLYVTNSESDAVTVIDRQRDIVVGAIAVGQQPVGIVTSPDRTKVYVANSGSNNISVIDTDANRVTNTIGNFGYSPDDLALSGDGRWLYATNPDSDNVSVIDTVSEMVTERITVGRRPVGITYDQDRGKVYVANNADNSISIIDAASNAVEHTVTVDLNPTGLAVQDDKLYVANSGSNTVSVIQIGSYSVTKTIPVGQRPLRVQSGLSGWVYVSIANNNEVVFMYTSMDMVTKNVSVGDLPSYMAMDTPRRKLYVVNRLSEDVSVVDLATKKVKAVIEVGRKPCGIAVIEE